MQTIIDTIDVSPVIKELFEQLREDKRNLLVKELIKQFGLYDVVELETVQEDYIDNMSNADIVDYCGTELLWSYDMEDIYDTFGTDLLDEFVNGWDKYDLVDVINDKYKKKAGGTLEK